MMDSVARERFIELQKSNGWICTDPDTLQFAQKAGDTWNLKQLNPHESQVNDLEESMIIGEITLSDYTDEELEGYCNFFGGDLESVRSENESDDSDMLLAEYIFETDYLN